MLNLTMAGLLIFISAMFTRIDTGVTLMAGLTALMFIIREACRPKESDNE